MTYKEMIIEILKAANKPLSTKEIHQESSKMDLKFGGKTPWETIGANIYVDIKENKENSLFMIASKRPTTFWLKSRQSELDNPNSKDLETSAQSPRTPHQKATESKNFNERDLHPLLVSYLYRSQEFNLDCRTIFHEHCKKAKSGQNLWNYPDIVGVYMSNDFYEKTRSLLKNFSQNSYKLYSFELKKRLSFANLKESYFQAVSNSSWANEGYLVVFEEVDEEVLNELRRLNQSFGIGLIKLECNVDKSKILLSASVRELDTQTLNKLVEDSPDFAEFVEDINHIIEARGIPVKDNFDKPFQDENEIEKYCKEKHIKNKIQ